MTKRKGAGPPKAADRGPKVDVVIQDEIGAKLRQLYADVVEEAVPERFLDLLKQLEKGGKREA
jgi:hypothetical protein